MNEKITIKNGDLDLYYSGTVIVNENKPTSMTLSDPGNNSITFIFNFINDKGKTEIVYKSNDGSTLGLNLKNFNSVFGHHNTEDWKVGQLNGRELLLFYRIKNLQETKYKEMTYSFYLGKETKNG